MIVSVLSVLTSLAVTLKTKSAPLKCLSAVPSASVGASFIVSEEPAKSAASVTSLDAEKMTACELPDHETVRVNQ